MAREMKLEDHKAEELGLTPGEYAFYSILSENSSTQHLEDNRMKESDTSGKAGGLKTCEPLKAVKKPLAT